MKKLYLNSGKVITSESDDADFVKCTCNDISCNECAFGKQCGSDFRGMSFGDAMKVRENEINKMVDYVEETDDIVEHKKKYTFEFTDEQAIYLSAFMNVFNEDEIPDVLDALNFYDKPDYPFMSYDADKGNIPDEWREGNKQHVEAIILAISYEIFNKLKAQREFD